MIAPRLSGTLAIASALALASIAACDARGCDGEATPVALPALRAELSGCAAVTRGPICEVTAASHEVRLAVDAADAASVEARHEGVTLPVAITDAGPGRLVTIDVPVAPGKLVVTSNGAAYEVTLARGVTDPALDEVAKLRREGHLKEAVAAMPDPDAMPAAVRGKALSLKARLDLASGRAEDAIGTFRASMERHAREGRVSDQVLDGMAMVYALGANGRRYAEAREVLAGLGDALASWDEGRARIGYYEALLARDAGDTRSALRLLSATEASTTRLGLDGEARNARQVRAILLQHLGRHEEAITALTQLEADLDGETDACRRADLWTDLGWAGIWLAEQGIRTAVNDPAGTAALGARLEATLALYRDACPQPMDVLNAHVNLAFFALQQGDSERAARELAAARAMDLAPGSLLAAWLLDLEGRAALAQHDPRRALARFDELDARARAAYFTSALWRAAVGRGLARSALGDAVGAVLALVEAERILDEEGRHVPLAEGRATFLSDREKSARLLSDALVAAGRTGEAMDVVRRARVRALASARRQDRLASLSAADRARWDEAMGRYARERDALDDQAEDDWKLAADKLGPRREARRDAEARARAALDDALALASDVADAAASQSEPRPGELWLAFHPTGDGKYRVFARDASGTDQHVTPWPPAADGLEGQAAALLGPVEARIERARRIRVLPYGAMQSVDFHALPFRGAPLVDHAPVAYAADLPEAPTRPAVGRARALVVADTQGDLPHALREANAVHARLGGDFDVTLLLGERATRPLVLSAVAQSSLLHFAGHGVFAGSRGFESALTLSGTSQMSLGDVLALAEAPARVVLSGCETGKSGAARVTDMSLANAFLAAGSDVVVAAARPVDDRLAGAFAEALYASVNASDWDVVAAFRVAGIAARTAFPGADWASYRVMTR